MTWQAEGIRSYDLRPLDGCELPAFTAGSHIDVLLPDGRLRQYSICNDPAERHRYVIAVQLEVEGRGGSRLWCETALAGAEVQVSRPRNNFALAPTAARHLLLAGGIGITPVMAMLRQLERDNADWRLHYCTRTPERTAFLEELAPGIEAGRVSLHYDGGDPARGFHVAGLLATQEQGTHLYYCGPPGFMAAVRQAAVNWSAGSVHCEHFSAPPEAAASASGAAAPAGKESFTVRIEGTDTACEVPPEVSIIEALRGAGVAIPTSCESGLCRTCMTRYVEGEPEHHDYALEENERKEWLLPCCARSRSPVLVLSL